MRGAAKAPPLIREELASDAYNPFTEDGTDISELDITDKGDFELSGNMGYMEMETITAGHLEEGFRLLTLGGDHSITYPVVKAHAEYHDAIHIVHLDAHSDLYDEFEGDRYSHACPFARIMEGGYAERLVQVGIRAGTAHQREQAERFGVEIHEARHFDRNCLKDLKKPVYLSVDMDVLDPAFAPGISHREAGGLTSRQLIDLILSIPVPVIGADLVEYNPDRDADRITASVAAKLMRELLAKLVVSRK